MGEPINKDGEIRRPHRDMGEMFWVHPEGVLLAQVHWTTVYKVVETKAMERQVRAELNQWVLLIHGYTGYSRRREISYFEVRHNGLSLYIQTEMEFLTVSILMDAFHYYSKIESKQKGKSHFATKPIGRTFNNKLSSDSNKSRHPS